MTRFQRASGGEISKPLESGEIAVTRAEHQHCYTARFQLLAAMNPRPCGLVDNEDGNCCCSPDMIRRYRQGASGPLMGRIDLHVKLSRPSSEALLSAAPTEKSSAQMRERVTVAGEARVSMSRINTALSSREAPTRVGT